MEEIQKESDIIYSRKEKTISDVIKEGSIVWFKSSNRQIHCGRVDKVYPETNEAMVFNFDAWTHWQVSYDRMVRVGINSFNGDDYNNWMSNQIW